MATDSYERFIRSADGVAVKRYSATDPADESVWCTCGKPMCPRARLRPFREHVSELHRVIANIHDESNFIFDVAGILYSLRLAASIEDVEADTGYVDNPEIFALCEPTIDYEYAHSEMASKYVAGTVIFQFLWRAYEAAVSFTAPLEHKGLLKEHRLGERGRRLFSDRPGLSSNFQGLSSLVHLTLWQCHEGGRLDSRLKIIEELYPNKDLVAAAEIAREFRNFLFHGEDEVPDHEDWGSAVISRNRLYRFYTVSRLVLYLIQALLQVNLEASYSDNAEIMALVTLLRTLQLKTTNERRLRQGQISNQEAL